MNNIFLLVLLFSFSGVILGLDNQQKKALEALYKSTNGKHWARNNNWLKKDPCTNKWYGVGCYDDDTDPVQNVHYLGMKENGLVGTIPTELGALTFLEYLYLDMNELSGTIPTELGSLTSLTAINLGMNDLNGTIPTELGSFSSVTKFYLHMNSLSGTLPTELGTLTSVSNLYLYTNSLSGYVEEWVCDTTTCEMSDNLFFCPLPSNCDSCEPCYLPPSPSPPPSPPPPPPPPFSSSPSPSPDLLITIYAIILIIGSVILIVGIIVGVYYCLRKRSQDDILEEDLGGEQDDILEVSHQDSICCCWRKTQNDDFNSIEMNIETREMEEEEEEKDS